jgi:hypothetical protein
MQAVEKTTGKKSKESLKTPLAGSAKQKSRNSDSASMTFGRNRRMCLNPIRPVVLPGSLCRPISNQYSVRPHPNWMTRLPKTAMKWSIL